MGESMIHADQPGPGQESVWDYPRPPRIETCLREIRVVFGEITIAKSIRTKRVLETSHPPVYYIPPDDIRDGCLIPTDRISICEWKGAARYSHVMAGDFSVENAAWSYPEPTLEFAPIADYVAFYAQLMDACYVDGQCVQAQLGAFYGGWITSHTTGPFKDAAGTLGW